MSTPTPYEVVQRLQATSSKKEKEAIVRDAWEQGCTEFFIGAQLAYDKLTTFGVAKAPLSNNDSYGADVPWGLFAGLLHGLKTRELTGNAAKTAIQNFADSCWQNQWNDWYRRVLLKDLSCGVTEGTINRVLAEFGDQTIPFRVPVFAIQRAHDGADKKNQKRVRGRKYLDYKFDGVRLTSHIVRDDPSVTQLTRSGNINDNFPKIRRALERIRPFLNRDIVLDAEIMSENFNRLMTMLNRKSADKVDTSDSVLVVFDVIGAAEFKAGYDPTTQRERHAELLALRDLFETHCDGRVVVLDKYEVDLDTPEGQAKLAEMKEIAAQVVDEVSGRTLYEGVMVKDPEAPYEGKKGYHWLKVKPWIEVDLTIVGYEMGDEDGKRAGKVGAYIAEGLDEDSGKFIKTKVGGGLSDELIDELTANPQKALGQIVTVRADAITDNEDGGHSLRFPRHVKFRSINEEPGEKD